MDKLAERIYNSSQQDLAIFKKTHDQWGEYSNMASGFPIIVNNTMIRSSEALYQALKFTDHPEIQKKIISEKSPMTAKMVAKPYKHLVRDDFEEKKILFMKWAVRAKLMCNYNLFKSALLASNSKLIVEESRRDSFWGAKRQDDGKLVGVNVLGRILMGLREELQQGEELIVLGHLKVPNFYLFGEQILLLERRDLIQSRSKEETQRDFFK